MGRAPSINVILWTSFMPLLGGTLKGNSAINKFAYCTDATNMLDESDKTAQNGRRERFWQKKITALQNLHPSPQNRALYNFSSAVHTILHHMIKQVALIAGSL